ncbi:helix-turn-helix domain-containing protein [Lactococcus lactis subsp. lactis]|uniref:Prophage pi1 protein 03, transcriptional regulator n=5 Tax=Lactococcus TaxID=1357 RepID=Q9CIC6_LACLA|nr:S24 family peptidase [Lactococcus lactis]NP_076698.1 transcriptional regulator [Lactococcus phage bIL309]MRM76976.1 helix-turn-helix domain-containing protein [Lactococcus cremoris]AAK04536.1 prophage pi1 protein 03, transcriptional regulator [Lactococcus lactis subsp. lactis Il1403]AAK08351.1 repressor [Lactococcus phage bIL309]ARD95427.2 S24 family peptidase [Lactococcus lactis subsp. lactis]ARE07658.2 S24 family peptidase [Lactococcus lactis subsp. lactis]
MKKIRLPEMIDYFRKENGWTMKEFGEKLGKSESAISKWIKGVRSPMVEDFDKMVNLFNTDPDTLMYGASDLSTTLSEINKISSQLEEPRQKVVLNTATNQLDEQNQEKKKESKVIPINKIPDDLPPYISRKILENFVMPTNTMEYEPDEDMVDVPILGRIAAGLPLDAVENFDGTRPVPAHFLSSARDYYWLMVDGHSMEPKIPFGSYVLIEAVPDVTDGTIGAVLFQDDCQATLKKVYHEIDCLRLVSINKEFKDQFATQDNPAAVIGQAVKVEIDL